MREPRRGSLPHTPALGPVLARMQHPTKEGPRGDDHRVCGDLGAIAKHDSTYACPRRICKHESLHQGLVNLDARIAQQGCACVVTVASLVDL